MSLAHSILTRYIKSSSEKLNLVSQLFVICTKNHNGVWVLPLLAVRFVNALIRASGGCVAAAVVISGHEQDGICR